MRVSREKIVRISHQIVDLLVQTNEVEFVEDRDTIRQHMVQTMTNILREEEKIEVEVRKKISVSRVPRVCFDNRVFGPLQLFPFFRTFNL